jgi:hypothetical protein
MTYSASIYFLGQYRPAYFQASSMNRLKAQMRLAIDNLDRDNWEWFAWRIDEAFKRVNARNCSGVNIEHGCRGLSIAKRPHDPWLDNVIADLPAFPHLNYPTIG